LEIGCIQREDALVTDDESTK